VEVLQQDPACDEVYAHIQEYREQKAHSHHQDEVGAAPH
jgi:hypothetical protein